jgi:hypothetical protein
MSTATAAPDAAPSFFRESRRYIMIVVSLAYFVRTAFKFMPSSLSPVLWTSPNALRKLEGLLAPNDILSNARKVVGDWSGPESIAFHSKSGEAYAALSDGTVGLFTPKGEFVKRVFFTGGYLAGGDTFAKGKPRNGLTKGTAALREHCTAQGVAGELAWNTSAERTCGRPLGLRFVQKGWSSKVRALQCVSRYLRCAMNIVCFYA